MKRDENRMNYKNGKIYVIRSYQTDNIYIGSTTQPLTKRLSKHKEHYKIFQGGKGHRTTSFDIVKYEDAYIELLEEFPCETKEQLSKREGHHIRNTKCVNKCIAGRTRSEYREDNRELLREKKRKYNADNRELINSKHTCECGLEYTHNHKRRHERTQRHIEIMKKKVECAEPITSAD